MKLPHLTLLVSPLVIAASCAMVRSTASPLTSTADVAAPLTTSLDEADASSRRPTPASAVKTSAIV